MRTTAERIDAVKNRTYELKIKQKSRQNKKITLLSMAVCFAIVVGMGFAMPGIMEQILSAEFAVTGNAGSIFISGNAIGYVMIAIIAFCLGVCVAVLCIRLHKSNKEDNHHDRNN